ncbi:biotin transport system substrate-specific component [Candidatus Planktophila versatilis]|uniref:Biotin transporter n=1 Tax=Candidatus Planktophila versatilis TaxID=1884905 RepID=A0AAD0E728_9ACTN|nr:biotin transporter BioY [Candidatus Planktophila versatilis]ASY23049.1 biotin transport system substrate-specific component [Candidatus Planktophila versatilis]
MSIQSGSLRATVFPRSSALTQVLFVAAGVAFIALLAQIAIPVPGSPVPVTGQTLAVLLIGTTYGARLGVLTFATYLLAGVAGAPIFAPSGTSANHGIDRLIGATGGYLVGMLVASLVLGYLADRKADQKFRTSFPALLLGDAIIFTFGLLWLQQTLDLSWSKTIAAGFTPFILGEAIKIAITATSLPLVWRRISRTLNK